MTEERARYSHGGRREGAGRGPLFPDVEEPIERRMVTLPRAVVRRLREMDPTVRYKKGNISLGILEALRRLDELEGRG